MMRREKRNRKNRRAKKFVVCTLLLALVATGIHTQKVPLVYAEGIYDDEDDTEKRAPLAPYTDEQGIEYYSFDGKNYIARGGASVTKSNITIPSIITLEGKSHPVTMIDIGAFGENDVIETVTIKNGIKAIGPCSFSKCSNLKSVTIPNSVTKIEKSAFKKNSNLTKVVIGSKLKTIGASAFEEDKKLKSITIKSKNLKSKSVGTKALNKTNSKLVIKVPAKKVAAYKKLFKGKGNKKVTVKKI